LRSANTGRENPRLVGWDDWCRRSLVGHSCGGAVITNAATGDQQVKALVYVDAFAPAQGQTIDQLVTAHPGSCVLPTANVITQP